MLQQSSMMLNTRSNTTSAIVSASGEVGYCLSILCFAGNTRGYAHTVDTTKWLMLYAGSSLQLKKLISLQLEKLVL